jgi:hypothetical protein
MSRKLRAPAPAAPAAVAELKLTPAQVREVGAKVALRALPGKGLGLVARRALRAHTRVGVYGGRVYPGAAHRRLVASGAVTGKYAIDFFAQGRGGKVEDDLIMEPGAGDAMDRRHANVLAAYVNEPGAGQVPNVVWVRNYGAGTMELWTTRAVRRGEELTACYGTGYARDYATPCTARPGALHYLRPGMARPRPV